MPASLLSIDARLRVAGKTYEYTQTCPCTPLSTWDVEWDGADAYGRAVQGTQTASFEIDYWYQRTSLSFAQQGRSFARWGQSALPTQITGRIAQSKSWPLVLEAWDARSQGLGGLTLDVVHALDVPSGTVFLGDGTRANDASLGPVVHNLSAATNASRDVAVLTSGEVIWSEGVLPVGMTTRIRKLKRDGTVVTVAGKDTFCGGTTWGPAATSACIGGNDPSDLIAARDGGFFLATGFRVFHIDPQGYMSLVAGNGTAGATGNGGLATSATINPQSLAEGPDGALYIGQPKEIRRVGPDGIIQRVAGDGALATPQNDGQRALSAHIANAASMAFGPDGSLYFLDNNSTVSVVRKIDPGGTVTRVAGTYSAGVQADGIPASSAKLVSARSITLDPAGNLFISHMITYAGALSQYVIRRVDSDGIIYQVAGNIRKTGVPHINDAFYGDGGPAAAAFFNSTPAISAADDGNLYFILTDSKLRVIQPATTNMSTLVPSKDGSEIYVFDARGRHLATKDARRGTTRWTMSYDGAGRLSAVTDAFGQSTTIERPQRRPHRDRRPPRAHDDARPKRRRLGRARRRSRRVPHHPRMVRSRRPAR